MELVGYVVVVLYVWLSSLGRRAVVEARLESGLAWPGPAIMNCHTSVHINQDKMGIAGYDFSQWLTQS
jgi:hypothetical protein